MGSDMINEHWRVLNDLLTRFDREPKDIFGRRATAWFRVGEEIFKEFFKLGVTIQWDYSKIQGDSDLNNINSEVNNICSGVNRNIGWLGSFISLYPNLRLDFEFASSADDICQVRSGIDVLLKGFSKLYVYFDEALDNLREEGDIEDFDRCLKIWIDSGFRPDFLGETNNVFSEHWWWF